MLLNSIHKYLFKLSIVFEKFEDLDIPEFYPDVARSVISGYQWSLPGVHATGGVSNWEYVNVTSLNNTWVSIFCRCLLIKALINTKCSLRFVA
jgi:hypothetical protein